MQVREIVDDDFIEISNWLSLCEWPMPPAREVLPKTGYVAVNAEGRRVAAAWVYVTNAKLLIVSWICTPPDIQEESDQGLDALFDYIEKESRGNAILYMIQGERRAKSISKRRRTTRPKTTFNTFTSRGGVKT